MILADTDVLIDYLAGVPAVKAQVQGYIEADQLQTSAVTCFELLSGARQGKRGDVVRALLTGIVVLPLHRKAAERAAELRRELDGSGQPIGMADSLIAGIALAQGLHLFTRNRKHFERVPGLNLVPIALDLPYNPKPLIRSDV